MKIKVIGSGWYGCHIALSLLNNGHEVELHEKNNEIFSGASGKIPARLHLGAPHYPRSLITQDACREHQKSFLQDYGFLTKGVPVNIYAIADYHSNIDFGTYKIILRNQIEFITIFDPKEFGLQNVEGAVMTGERHIVINKAKKYFNKKLHSILQLNSKDRFSEKGFDYIIDCTFCSNDSIMIDRFEPCLVLLLEGPTYKSITIMDGPFPSLYTWDEEQDLLSLSSAKYTPFSKSCKTHKEANNLLNSLSKKDIIKQGEDMINSMANFYPSIKEKYKVVDYLLSIRAMPLSAADTRLVHTMKMSDKLIRVRAGKIDAVHQAYEEINKLICQK